SRPGRQPGRLKRARLRSSPGLSEMAATRTSASAGPGIGASTGPTVSRVAPVGSTITARIVLMPASKHPGSGVASPAAASSWRAGLLLAGEDRYRGDERGVAGVAQEHALARSGGHDCTSAQTHE